MQKKTLTTVQKLIQALYNGHLDKAEQIIRKRNLIISREDTVESIILVALKLPKLWAQLDGEGIVKRGLERYTLNLQDEIENTKEFAKLLAAHAHNPIINVCFEIAQFSSETEFRTKVLKEILTDPEILGKLKDNEEFTKVLWTELKSPQPDFIGKEWKGLRQIPNLLKTQPKRVLPAIGYAIVLMALGDKSDVFQNGENATKKGADWPCKKELAEIGKWDGNRATFPVSRDGIAKIKEWVPTKCLKAWGVPSTMLKTAQVSGWPKDGTQINLGTEIATVHGNMLLNSKDQTPVGLRINAETVYILGGWSHRTRETWKTALKKRGLKSICSQWEETAKWKLLNPQKKYEMDWKTVSEEAYWQTAICHASEKEFMALISHTNIHTLSRANQKRICTRLKVIEDRLQCELSWINNNAQNLKEIHNVARYLQELGSKPDPNSLPFLI